ncbi:MAG: hypothetical protein DRO40_01485 [Thermoprotei archaeon]|nr:MAG: hypothetical protein DRO40_01485 [Thermoprotei archaeon]
MVEKTINEPYDPYLTIYPSFLYPFFDYINNYKKWVKTCGYCKGAVIEFRDNTILLHNCNDDKVLPYWTGLWFVPRILLYDIEPRYMGFIENLVEKFEHIRLAISPQDPIWVFISVFLSRNTNFHTITVKWIKDIARFYENDPTGINVLKIGRSYQLRQLKELLGDKNLWSLIESIRSNYNNEKFCWKLRKTLISRRFIGPKTADAFLLFSTQCSLFTPADRHYLRFTRKYFGQKLVSPNKRYCLINTCYECPISGNCITGWSILAFGRMSGWIQTIAYLIGKKKITL